MVSSTSSSTVNTGRTNFFVFVILNYLYFHISFVGFPTNEDFWFCFIC